MRLGNKARARATIFKGKTRKNAGKATGNGLVGRETPIFILAVDDKPPARLEKTNHLSPAVDMVAVKDKTIID